jgi:hypothetical protein
MKKLILNTFILAFLSIALSFTNAIQAQQINDTLTLHFGNTSRMILLIDNTGDLKTLRSYDLNALVAELDSLVEAGLITEGYALDGQGRRIPLRDTTITLSTGGTRESPKTVARIRLNNLNLDVRYDTLTNTLEIQDYSSRRPQGRTRVYTESTPSDNESHTSETSRSKRRHSDRRTTHHWNLDLGLNNYLQNGSFPDALGEPWGLRPLGSRYVAISTLNRTRLGQPGSVAHIQWGLSLDWYNFMFQDNVQIQRGPDQAFVSEPAVSGRNLDKSKLTAAYINTPLMLVLDFGKSKNRGFNIGFGGYTGYRIAGYSKIRYEDNNRTRRERNHDNFYLNNVRYGLTAQVGYRGVTFFGNYDLNPLFSEGRGPGGQNLNAVSFGIRL